MALADYRSVSSLTECPNEKGMGGEGGVYIEHEELQSVPVQNKVKEVTSDLLFKVLFCTPSL